MDDGQTKFTLTWPLQFDDTNELLIGEDSGGAPDSIVKRQDGTYSLWVGAMSTADPVFARVHGLDLVDVRCWLQANGYLRE